ncbi:NAD-dependent epimerase/dehydratase family protein [Curtobacterium sp. UCD-KPL2560]|uniref:NAD-dependent epimerase/dehydratase family protein n=1 Tax=Curtobacterium sp. UCD-KPL2560 TaxID=1885315 RepID=UPI000826B596|nr:NAD-dependent epimerase/dehydratase family protein [Curtobacterium sp. UCD-KPL2560]
MRVAITGGTGFVGRHLAERYDPEDVVIVSRRTGIEIDDVDALTEAFAGVDTVAHCAGINREIGDQSFERVHIRGTAAVLEAAHRAGVQRVVLLSFLRARPGTGSPYHETKWAAEEMVRASGLDYTVLKAGMIYGHGDRLVDHLSHTVQTVPLFASVGLREKTISPIPVAELVDVLVGALEGRLSRRTVAVRGGEALLLSEAVRRVAGVVGRPVWVFPAPVWAHRVLAQVTEWTMRVPLVAKAQVRMLAEGVTEATQPAGELPDDLAPKARFDSDHILAALPPRGGFTCRDLRLPGRP